MQNRMLKSMLNGGNLIKAINTYAVAAIRYTAGIVKWNKEKLDTLDRKTRKRLTTYGGFFPKSMCRLCKEKEETVSHIVSECSKIAQTEYKKRHDRVATTIHWALCKKYGLPHMEK